MEENDFTLPSGAKLHVTVVPFQEAKALLKALLKTASGISLGSNPLDMDVSILKDAMINALTSDEVEAKMWPCLGRCTYDDVVVTPQLFDDPKIGQQVRKDYFAIMMRVAEVNCTPFFAQTLSTLKTFLAKRKDSPAS